MTHFQKAAARHRGFAKGIQQIVGEEIQAREMEAKQAMAAGAGKLFGAIGCGVAGMKPGRMQRILAGSGNGNLSGIQSAMGKAAPVGQMPLPGMGTGSMGPAAGGALQGMQQGLGKDVAKRVGVGAGAGYLMDQNGQRRGQNNMAQRYNSMGYFPKLMMALSNKQIPQMSAMNPAWTLPGV